MAYNNPVISDFTSYFARDFQYGVTQSTVMDQDVSNALQSTAGQINPGLYANQQAYTIGYLYLSAHYLVMALRASSQGMFGQYNFLQASKGVADVNEAFAIPQRILDNPEFSMLCKTTYGQRYLFDLLPQLCGNMYNVYGRTKS